MSSDVDYTDVDNHDQTVNDIKTRITVSFISNRLLNLFESGDLEFVLDLASFS